MDELTRRLEKLEFMMQEVMYLLRGEQADGLDAGQRPDTPKLPKERQLDILKEVEPPPEIEAFVPERPDVKSSEPPPPEPERPETVIDGPAFAPDAPRAKPMEISEPPPVEPQEPPAPPQIGVDLAPRVQVTETPVQDVDIPPRVTAVEQPVQEPVAPPQVPVVESPVPEARVPPQLPPHPVIGKEGTPFSVVGEREEASVEHPVEPEPAFRRVRQPPRAPDFAPEFLEDPFGVAEDIQAQEQMAFDDRGYEWNRADAMTELGDRYREKLQHELDLFQRLSDAIGDHNRRLQSMEQWIETTETSM